MDDRRDEGPGRRWSDQAIDVVYESMKLLSPVPNEVGKIANRVDHIERDVSRFCEEQRAMRSAFMAEIQKVRDDLAAEKSEARKLRWTVVAAALAAAITSVGAVIAALVGG